MKINKHHPHTEFQFDENGNLISLEARNFSGIGKQCQGRAETRDYEQALVEAEFIEPIDEKRDRTFKKASSYREQPKQKRRLSH